MWLQYGNVKEIGSVSSIVNKYISGVQQLKLRQSWGNPEEAPGNEFIRFKKVEMIPQLPDPNAPIDVRTQLNVRFQFWNMEEDALLNTGLHLFSISGECIFDVPSPAVLCKKGIVEGECIIPGNLLNDGTYYISIIVVKDTSIQRYYFEECISFDVEDYRGDIKWYDKWWGAVRPKLPYTLKQLEVV